MAPNMRHHALTIRNHRRAIASTPVSACTTPNSSAYPSAYPSDAEDVTPTTSRKVQQSFPFLCLPSELRTKIYTLVFAPLPPVIDLDPSTFSIIHRHKLLTLFSVCKQLYNESSHHFFSTYTFRIFPIHPGRYFKTRRPLLARLPPRYRNSITTLELRLGPGWNSPPRGWVVTPLLGLLDCTSVRVLNIFVECDPSDAIFKGFRAGDGFYEGFCQELLEGIFRDVKGIQTVKFDAFPGIKRSGDMMSGLREVVERHQKVVGWGPERGWGVEKSGEGKERVWLDAVLVHGVGRTRVVPAGVERIIASA
ncbi:hypothetical protein DSL72_004074 [Monilinia vaccinii-corymbosi]|uniref:F-box domain-containing protein n=1 Tax=Monilinia vaccinii-corymbosi TaxID=61207 RepID=A0A8A3P8H3_9HELO|nr:hypothetical protein DSL72_004074 [Monilinia vaccinii-corymbosi]